MQRRVRQFLRRMVQRRASSLSLLILLVCAAGCAQSSVSGERDPVADAIQINKNLERGQRLIQEVQADWNFDELSQNVDSVPKLMEAEELFSEARKLSGNSSKPRIALGQARSLIGYVYFGQYLDAVEQITEIEKAGSKTPTRLVQTRDDNLEKAKEWLVSANRELEYYVRTLIAQFPNDLVFEQLSTNYEYLGDYARSEEMLRRFLTSNTGAVLTREQRVQFEARARALRQKRLDETE